MASPVTQHNLGNALSTLGSRESGTDRLEEAVIAYRAALSMEAHFNAYTQKALAQVLAQAEASLAQRRAGSQQ